MTSHEYGVAMQQRAGVVQGDYLGDLNVRRMAEVYRQATETYNAASTWASLRGIRLTGDELVSAYKAAGLTLAK